MDELVQLATWKQLIVFTPLGAVLAVCAWTDFRERKVYNKVTYPAFFVGLLCSTIALGWSGLGWALAAASGMFVLGLILLPFGWIGGGDIKLLIASAAFLGPTGLAQLAFYSVLVGGVAGVVLALFNGYLWEMLKRMFRYLRGWFRVLIYQSTNVREPMEKDERSKIPFAISVFVGGILAYTDAAFDWPGLWEIFLRGFQV